MKVSELEGPLLDAWVGKAEGFDLDSADTGMYSREWALGGRIIEREEIQIGPEIETGEWRAYKFVPVIDPCRDVLVYEYDGLTPLIAAMRCYVASKYGEEIPDMP
jgi:hypothetical protein